MVREKLRVPALRNTSEVDEAIRLQSKILVIGDSQTSAHSLEKIFVRAGYAKVLATSSTNKASATLIRFRPDLVVADIHVSSLDGLELMRQIVAAGQSNEFLPLIVLSKLGAIEEKLRAFSLGVCDVLEKPARALEILARAKVFLKVKLLQRQLASENGELEHNLTERTRELQRAYVELLERLALVGEFRDDDTRQHTERVSEMAAAIGSEMGLDQETCTLLRYSTLLHDLGKVAVPDAILLKAGRLTPEEMAVMRTHAEKGAEILSDSSSPLLNAAEVIARHHHERWDGAGYPKGLSGKTIPLLARIVAVADVFDALTQDRPYKAAWPFSVAIAEIRKLSGTHFDPEVVDAFLRAVGEDSSQKRAA